MSTVRRKLGQRAEKAVDEARSHLEDRRAGEGMLGSLGAAFPVHDSTVSQDEYGQGFGGGLYGEKEQDVGIGLAGSR